LGIVAIVALASLPASLWRHCSCPCGTGIVTLVASAIYCETIIGDAIVGGTIDGKLIISWAIVGGAIVGGTIDSELIVSGKECLYFNGSASFKCRL